MRSFVLQKNVDPSMHLRQFHLQVANNNATLHWEWPIDRSIRMALVFECHEETPSLETLINEGRSHEVVMRDLASHFTTEVSEGRSKFLVYPAYFDDNKNIAVCDAPCVTDWVYEKIDVSAQVLYSPVHLSQYQKATIKITPSDVKPDAFTYKIKEQGRTIATYPLDTAIIASGGHVYIKKTQTIEFILHMDYAHLIDMK